MPPYDLGRLVAAGDPRLVFDPDLARARKIIAGHVTRDRAQAGERERMLAFVDAHPDALLRTCVEGHLTASALVVDADGRRGLLTLHRKLGRWLQVGGHCDGDANLPGVALREASEESGIDELAIDPVPVDLDVHVIPERAGEAEHLHLDTRFLVRAGEGARLRISEESRELRWFGPEELGAIETDESVRRLFRLAFAR